jgi:hypothetical protein
MTLPAQAARAAGRACPSCRSPMRRAGFEHRAGGAVELELCLDCRGIWFDGMESAQLAPPGILALFRVVQAAREHGARPLGGRLSCPACAHALEHTQDYVRTTRFNYYRCGSGHGRFTPFVQFLREKEFVRSLTAAEIVRLSATVKQVRCSSCGGAIDLVRDPACPYCRSPVEVLDAHAVERTLERLHSAGERKPVPDAAALAREALSGGRRRSTPLPAWFPDAGSSAGWLSLDGIVDLVADALDSILPDFGDPS